MSPTSRNKVGLISSLLVARITPFRRANLFGFTIIHASINHATFILINLTINNWVWQDGWMKLEDLIQKTLKEVETIDSKIYAIGIQMKHLRKERNAAAALMRSMRREIMLQQRMIPTDRQRKIAELVLREGLTLVDAGKREGVYSGSVKGALDNFCRKANGEKWIEGLRAYQETYGERGWTPRLDWLRENSDHFLTPA